MPNKPALHSDNQVSPLRRIAWTGRVSFAISAVPRGAFAELILNPTPPGHLTRERQALIGGGAGRD